MTARLPLWLELVAAILVALVVSNAVTVAVVEWRRAADIRSERLRAIEERVSAFAGLMAQLPATERSNLIRVASVPGERISISARPRVAANALRDDAAELRLRAAMSAGAGTDIRVAKRGVPDLSLFGPRQRSNAERLAVAIALPSREWLNAEFKWPDEASLLPEFAFSAAIAALALVAVAVWLSIRVSGPLQRLSEASSRMAEGRSIEPVPETGPFDLRSAASAFNTMSRRLLATLENQRNLLASIAHDLRTPITALKIKSEFIDDTDLRERMHVSLDELQTMTEAALAAAQSGIGEEKPREVDVTALVESLCADLADIGGDVTFIDSPAAVAICRPNEIRKAARNLIENAMRYGQRARVAVAMRDASTIAITIDDDGPGLKPDELERVFEPFVRLESSRNLSGGLGLGLSLCRAVAKAHGGDIVLANRSTGGLRATLTLLAQR